MENLEGPGNGPVLWEGPLLGSRHLGSGPSCVCADSTLLAMLCGLGAAFSSPHVSLVFIRVPHVTSLMLKSHHSPGVRAMSKPILLTTNEIGEGIRTTRHELESRALPDCRASPERMEPQPSASARPLPRGLPSNHLLYPTGLFLPPQSTPASNLLILCECSRLPSLNRDSTPCV